jgi:hypothetical protein
MRLLLVILIAASMTAQKRLPFRQVASGGSLCTPTASVPGAPNSSSSTWTVPPYGSTYCDPISGIPVTRITQTGDAFITDPNAQFGFSADNSRFLAATTGSPLIVYLNPDTRIPEANYIFNAPADPAISYPDTFEPALTAGGVWIDNTKLLAKGQRSLFVVDTAGPPPYTARILADFTNIIAVFKGTYPALDRDATLDECFFATDRRKGFCRIALLDLAATSYCVSACPSNVGYVAFQLGTLIPTLGSGARAAALANVTQRRRFFNGLDSANFNTFQVPTGAAMGSFAEPLLSPYNGGYKNTWDKSGEFAYFATTSDPSSAHAVLRISDGTWTRSKLGNHGIVGHGIVQQQETGGGYDLRTFTLGDATPGAENGVFLAGPLCFFYCASMYMHSGNNDIPYLYEGPDVSSYWGTGYPFGPPRGNGSGGFSAPNRIWRVGAETFTPVMYVYNTLKPGYTVGQIDIKQPIVSPDGKLMAMPMNFGDHSSNPFWWTWGNSVLMIAKLPTP